MRPQSRAIPKGATWIRDAAAAVDPAAQRVTTESGQVLGYDYLVMAPGLQVNFDQVPGLAQTLGERGVSSNYRYDLAPRTWEFIRSLRSGTAVFTMPALRVKCAGAPQKIAYLAADWWRREGVLDRIRVILVLPTAVMFSQPDWATGAHRHRGGLRDRGTPGIPAHRSRRGREAGGDRGHQGEHEGGVSATT